jgi:hypothetical protein
MLDIGHLKGWRMKKATRMDGRTDGGAPGELLLLLPTPPLIDKRRRASGKKGWRSKNTNFRFPPLKWMEAGREWRFF